MQRSPKRKGEIDKYERETDRHTYIHTYIHTYHTYIHTYTPYIHTYIHSLISNLLWFNLQELTTCPFSPPSYTDIFTILCRGESAISTQRLRVLLGCVLSPQLPAKVVDSIASGFLERFGSDGVINEENFFKVSYSYCRHGLRDRER